MLSGEWCESETTDEPPLLASRRSPVLCARHRLPATGRRPPNTVYAVIALHSAPPLLPRHSSRCETERGADTPYSNFQLHLRGAARRGAKKVRFTVSADCFSSGSDTLLSRLEVRVDFSFSRRFGESSLSTKTYSSACHPLSLHPPPSFSTRYAF